MLFFGCRAPDQDFIYQDEFEAAANAGLVTLHTAFSRAEGQPKAYVQDQILANQDEIWRLLEAGAVIYVCGDASKMAPDVRRAFATIFRNRTGANESMADAWLAGLDATGRYVADVWAA
jgi:cytochrome P450/NADPH-cytochrome P450 reductase